jgi:2-dehydro-3-deoxygluconokinase
MTRVLSIGECMVELRQDRKGSYTRGFGGDTLNTAIYLSRLGVKTSYMSALGDDHFSDEMIASWRMEGIDTTFVARVLGRMPGLYMIETDHAGERSFSYWREQSPAREVFAQPSQRISEALLQFEWIYFSGISLSLYGTEGRTRLFEYLQRANDAGAWIVFDTNFRERGWPDRREADTVFRKALDMADILFASNDDMAGIFGKAGIALFENSPAVEKILKLPDASARLMWHGKDEIVAPLPVKKVVDTTAAGDSFAAAYLAARINKESPLMAAGRGHRLANRVIQQPGAIIPRDKMPKWKYPQQKTGRS